MGKEENVPRGMSLATPTFFAVRHLCWWSTGCGGGGYPEKDIHPPCNKLAAALLQDVRIHQDLYHHHFGVVHKPVHPGVQSAGAQVQCPAPAVGSHYSPILH